MQVSLISCEIQKNFQNENEEFDNLSDKRFKDIVYAYKRNHLTDTKSTLKQTENKQIHLPMQKRAKSQYSDEFILKEKLTIIYQKI